MSKYSTKGVGGSYIPKTIQPGERKCKVNKIELQADRFKPEADYLVLSLETEPIEGFEGFWVDQDIPTLGRYKGQVGRVKSSFYAYKDRDFNGEEIKKEKEILRFVAKLATAMNVKSEVDDVSGDTLAEYIQNVSELITDKGVYLNYAIGVRRFKKTNGFMGEELFLLKETKGKVCLERVDVEESKLVKFDKNNTAHVVIKDKDKEKEKEGQPKTVNEFDAGIVETQDALNLGSNDELSVEG